MKKKLLFVNDEMVVGGVSKVLNNLLRHMDREKYELNLLVLHKHGDMLSDIPEDVVVLEGTRFFEVCDIPVKECLKTGKFIRKLMFFLLLKTGLIEFVIRKERKKMNLDSYDVEIAFKEGICSVFTACGNTSKKINWVHADYKVKNYAENYMHSMKKFLKRFDYHVAVSNVAAKSFEEIFELPEVKTIHNLMQVEQMKEKADVQFERRHDEFTFVCVGRLHPQKSYDRLLDAVAELNRSEFKFHVDILGDGPDKDILLKQAEALNVKNVHFLGNQSNPYPFIKHSDCLLLTSIYEGLPTVVFEALILHTPVLTTRVAGVDEQLEHGCGMIVDNTLEGIVGGMRQILSDEQLLQKYRKEVQEYTFSNQKILEKIENMLDEYPL
ncbi:MAG: glycosyltransferase [Erysipelotrichaceae bacterium]|nr:glycosyltransferase [Erysipelotrichaceae bacterium]